MPIISIEVDGKVKTPQIDPSCWVSESAWIIGDVVMGPENVVYQGAIIRGDFARIRIGAKNIFQDGCIVNTASRCNTRIGDNNLIGFSAIVHGATIKSNVVLGVQATLMIKVIVNDNALVGATSYVPMGKRIPAGQKWIGREVKGENTQGELWEAAGKLWLKMGQDMKRQKEKP